MRIKFHFVITLYITYSACVIVYIYIYIYIYIYTYISCKYIYTYKININIYPKYTDIQILKKQKK